MGVLYQLSYTRPKPSNGTRTRDLPLAPVAGFDPSCLSIDNRMLSQVSYTGLFYYNFKCFLMELSLTPRILPTSIKLFVSNNFSISESSGHSIFVLRPFLSLEKRKEEVSIPRVLPRVLVFKTSYLAAGILSIVEASGADSRQDLHDFRIALLERIELSLLG